MKPRGLAVAWVLVAVVFLLLLLVELAKWRSLTTEGTRAAAQRQRLTAEIELQEQQRVAEIRRHSPLLQELQWTSGGGDPSVFLTRLAQLAQERRMKILAISPRESRTTQQFHKSWHTIQVQAPYREIRELAARVEQERGILEDVRLEPAPTASGTPASAAVPADEIQARFKMAAVDLSAEAKRIMQRALAAGDSSTKAVAVASLALPVPTRVAQASPLSGRDPFAFLLPPAPPRPAVAAATTPVPPAQPPALLEVRGIVSFPDGFLAIVNNQIVKVGDTVSGHRVERIMENSVTLREAGATARTIDLPDLLGAAPAAPRR